MMPKAHNSANSPTTSSTDSQTIFNTTDEMAQRPLAPTPQGLPQEGHRYWPHTHLSSISALASSWN